MSFVTTAFSTNERQSEDFLLRVQELLGEWARARAVRVLEVGCGDGAKAVHLVECWPHAHYTGVDLSGPNIRRAELRRLASPARERLRFVTGDYLDLLQERYDVILADSVFHLIAAPTEKLFARLAGDLNPGGWLLFTMPCSCLYNTVLMTFRRLLRLVRCRLLDRLLLAVAGRLHGRSYSREFLGERLEYAYLLPYRMGSRALEVSLLANHHLAVEAVLPCAHRSIAQPRHRLWCFHRLPTEPAPSAATCRA
jgi:SAM-dependent methyltransferase